MMHYFLIDCGKKLHDHADLFVKNKMMPLDSSYFPGKDDGRVEGVPVLMYAVFRSHGNFSQWLKVEGVQYLGDPLDNEPISHAHMHKLKRIHKHEPVTSARGEVTGWKHPETGAVIAQNFHPRQIAKFAAAEHPDFVFRLFAT